MTDDNRFSKLVDGIHDLTSSMVEMKSDMHHLRSGITDHTKRIERIVQKNSDAIDKHNEKLHGVEMNYATRKFVNTVHERVDKLNNRLIWITGILVGSGVLSAGALKAFLF